MSRYLILFILVLFSIKSFAHQDQIYRGKYVWGHEVDSFTPCGVSEGYWATYNLPGYELVDFYRKNTTKPYQEIYIEFRGIMLNEKLEGEAEGWRGPIHISEIFAMQKSAPKECS